MKKMSVANIFKMLGKESATWLVLGVAASLILSLLEVALGSALQLIIAKLSDTPNVILLRGFNFLKQFSLGELCVALSLLGLFRGCLQVFTSQSGHLFDIILNTRLRNLTLYDLLISHREKSVAASEIGHRFSEIFPKSGSFISVITFGSVAFIQVAMVGAACATLNWKLSLFGLVSITISGTVLLFSRKKVLKISRALITEQANIAKALQKLSRNWIFIKISRTGRLEYQNIIKRLKNYYTQSRIMGFIIKALGTFPTVLGTAVISSMIYFGYSYFGLKGAELVGFTYLFYRFVQQFSAVVDSLSGATSYFPHFQESFNFFTSIDDSQKALAFNMFSNSKQLNGQQLKNTESTTTSPEIVINNLSYKWNNGPQVFSNFQLSITSNSIFGIVGASGCGKSTLLSLILGILKPNEGKIQINEEDPEQFFDKYSEKVGYVGAEPFLIEGSIKDNLTYGLSPFSYSEEKLKLSLELSQLKDFTNKLDYQISENSEGLSSGQKQRLALARAFMKDPKLLILDEATANLDGENERIIANILKEYKQDCTIIIVSHRSGILTHADATFNLETRKLIKKNFKTSEITIN